MTGDWHSHMFVAVGCRRCHRLRRPRKWVGLSCGVSETHPLARSTHAPAACSGSALNECIESAQLFTIRNQICLVARVGTVRLRASSSARFHPIRPAQRLVPLPTKQLAAVRWFRAANFPALERFVVGRSGRRSRTNSTVPCRWKSCDASLKLP